MPAKIERMALFEMRIGQTADFYAVLCERTRKTTRDGKPYFGLKFRDQKRTVSSPVWGDSSLFDPCEREWQVGHHFKIRAAYTEHPQYGPQIEIQNIRRAVPQDAIDGYDASAFDLSTHFDVNELFDELKAAASQISDSALRELVVGLLVAHRDGLIRCPAARRYHHAFRGGLIEHTVSVLRTGIYLSDKYAEYYPDLRPPINKDLVVAGCILHDIGKLFELDCSGLTTSHTVPGELIGHILIGRDLVRDAARGVKGLDPELLLLLEHIIVSHQGLKEWDSPKEPMLPEALLVHHADDLDAKMNIIAQALSSSESDDSFTDTNNAMRRRFLKRRTS